MDLISLVSAAVALERYSSWTLNGRAPTVSIGRCQPIVVPKVVVPERLVLSLVPDTELHFSRGLEELWECDGE